MPLLDRSLHWLTAAVCGYEAHAIVAKAFRPNWPLPTITVVVHGNRHHRVTYIVAGGVLGLLAHHLFVEGLDPRS